MSLTKHAIEKNRITLVALILIFVGGLYAFRTMSRAEDPGFIVRTARIMTYFPGASPERVEQLITDKLEKAIQEMPEVDFISSESKTGVSIIYVSILESYKKMRPIWDDLRRKVGGVRENLPDGIRGPFVNDDFGDVFGTVITITGEGYTYAELKNVADQVRDELLLIEEVAKVDIYGAQEERIFVEYNNARLAELGLSPYQLEQILKSRNIVFPGGMITTEHESIVLEPSGNFESVEELGRAVINLPGRRDLVYLEDVAKIYRGYIDPPTSKMRSSGMPCLGLAINLREGGNIIALGEKVKENIQRLQGLYPIGIEFDIVAFQPTHVDKKVKDFSRSLMQAVFIVLLVMLVTLKIRTGLVVASLIPMAMIMSLLIMSLMGIGLDQMSLASLIIALGMLVDNAIVMSESIMVQMSEGKKGVEAAVDSAAELRIPLLTASLTTAAAFLPIFLAESSTGEYTAPLFKVVTITLLCSWILALTMTPLLCVMFIKVRRTAEEERYDSKFYRKYRGFLLTMLRHRFLTVTCTIVAFLIAMQGFRFVPKIFFPPSDKAIFTAEFTLPMGSPIERTEEMVLKIEDFMKSELVANPDHTEGIENWATFIGSGAPRFMLAYTPEPRKPEYAIMIVNATSLEACKELISRMESFCYENFPDVKPEIDFLKLGAPYDAPVEVRISGRDEDVVFDLVDKAKSRLSSISGIKNMSDNWGARSKKLLVKINQPRARRAGLTSLDVALSLQTILTGYQTTEYREEDEVIPVTLRSVAAERKDIAKLESHNIFSQLTGRSVPLKQVADIEVTWQPAKILRRDRLKTVTIQADVTEKTLSIPIAVEIGKWLEEESKNWGIGYKYELGGEYESAALANQSINEKVPIAFLFILILLVSQFNSLRRPLIVLMTIPLGLIGVVIGLLMAKSYFGFMTLLGIISLAGIVINNAIVLLDRIKIEIEENGLEPPRAVIEAAQRRLRPIFLTMMSTVGGLLPLWFGGGPMWQPLAISIIFGLVFATVLTLGIVPVLYSLFFRVRFKEFQY
ncbi:MAG: AcrB/AcrD/AcrF family protein [Candidatus Latescibacteria bacterium]|nr:AcrB/AcrD/AcrF family protein [Candidatus Latescibacterota bacterium]NIM21834.1 AcrB/AcrD/AcrF family protein [Candidatus Latescibacterota bacterium]NIM66205.1 AcrB/AcrD/AcrF family protein [Candidatus Latescibacterota bacterium]NIO02729.1 AcrB/AcrD/AcrF family protein [Candidatus Latescibacterota bacterium]NIO29271.1 AcrB/AcrD/AcrF family protein [Candidatus Latescibacterota bacterium]